MVSIILRLALSLFAVLGVVAAGLALMLAAPVRPPPPLASIHDGARRIDATGAPAESRFQARDGTWLAYRLYPAENGASDRIAILAHGPSASSIEMHPMAEALSRAGITAAAIDARGHGASGTRGDIAYPGQLDDDLADLIVELRRTRPQARLVLIGHSAGGGFALRVASGPLGENFERAILLAPYLGYSAPTNRPSEGPGRWASPDIPRILAILALSKLGADWAQALPALAFANAPEARMHVTSVYTYRLMQNYTAPRDWKGALESARGRLVVIAGADDELMDAAAYERVLPALGVQVTILPGVDHMGVVYRPQAIRAVVAAAGAS